MTKGDQLVERGATRLQQLADRAAARGDGIGEWLSEELRNDAVFLRKLKPSLVKARATGNGPTNEAPVSATSTGPASPVPEAPPIAVDTPHAESRPTEVRAAPPPRPKPKSKSKAKKKPKKRRGGPPPAVIVGGALVAGILLAKIVDWRGHAHPRD